jgi:hypothetical protein
MPSKLEKMPKRFHCIKLISSLLILALFFCFTHYHTSKRISPTQISDSNDPPHYPSPKKDTDRQIDSPKILSRNDKSTNLSEKYDIEKEIWCEARDYVDLSDDPILHEFSRWLDANDQLSCLKTGNCTDHDPRLLAQHFSNGESLARTRAKLFQKIIRGDPRKALNLAIEPEVIASLPPRISAHLEKWESGFVDFQSIHRCFDENHPRGWIMNYAKFSNGQNYRAWSFGKRRKLVSQKGMAVWGVSMGSDIAIAEDSYRIKELARGGGQIFFGDGDVTYESFEQRDLLLENLRPSVRRVGGIRQVHYPLILASGMTANNALSLKYEIVKNRVTFDEALNAAIEQNGSLLRIDNETENKVIARMLREAFEEEELLVGFDENNNPRTLVWIGATDNEETNGTRVDEETNTTVQDVDIGAEEGDWRWINGVDENIFYENWKWGSPVPSNATKDFAAIDWNTSDGNATWEDVNGTHARLPYIIEKNFEMPGQTTNLLGIRKVLVIPARFADETTAYKSALDGSNNPLTNELGENILDDLQIDSYEPISREKIEAAMADVKEFFYRNTDERLKLEPVITSTVTLPLFRYNVTIPPVEGGGNPFDSDGSLTGVQEIMDGDTSQTIYGVPEEREILGTDPLDTPYAINFTALSGASNLSEEWNYEGFAFVGLSSLQIDSSGFNFLNTSFKEPPTVKVIGGEYRVNNSPHPRFREAVVDAIIDEGGKVTNFKIVEPGAYYDPSADINITINGEDFTNQLSVRVDYLLVSYVILSNYAGGAEGLGFVGGPGVHVKLSNGEVSHSTIAHEIGHNFGFMHAERHFTKSERPLSDEYGQEEYGNPYSVMGTADDISTGADFTIAGKVAMNNVMGSGGYTLGSQAGVDVAEIIGSTIPTSFIENTAGTNNTFRIYRSNYGRPPAGLKEASFTILGSLDLNTTEAPYELEILGSGQEANGSLIYDMTAGTWKLMITKPGRGYVSEPSIRVVDENQSTILILSPASIVEKVGTENYETASLLDNETRWIRGIKASVTNSEIRPVSVMEQGLMGEDLAHYFLSYRTDISATGLTVNVAAELEDQGLIEPFLLDTTPQTPNDFTDGPLLPGNTYSDYDADLHFTPVRTGGHDPMPYIEVVVHAGTVDANEAKMPDFALTASSTNPEPGEYIKLSAMVVDGNTSHYAYSWFHNEQALTTDNILNKPSIFLALNEVGYHVLRVVVSDMKGGIASRNLIISVGNINLINKSSISGTVRSRQNPVQGARVVLSKAPIIEHDVSLAGNFLDSFMPSASASPARFMIDGEIAPELNFHRGEIHRFNFDASLKYVTMSFIEGIEDRPPAVELNMLSDTRVDSQKGSAYIRNPQLTYSYRSAYSNYRTQLVGTYLDMLIYLQEHNASTSGGATLEINATSEGDASILDLLEYLPKAPETFENIDEAEYWNLIHRPYAKSLMQETGIISAKVGPLELNEFGAYLAYGGRGYDRKNTPVVEVRRSSIWEDYSKSNADASALVDGVNTISPVISTEFIGDTWESRPGDSIVPSVVVWGSGAADPNDPYSEVNASVTSWTDGTAQMRTVTIKNQGKGFEPNSTMAVLHYPLEPFAYWSFDRHESLFEDISEARHQPSPGWNKEPDRVNLKHHWKLDVNSSQGSPNEINASAVFSATENLSENSFENWGLLGKAIEVNSSNQLFSNRVFDENFTLSMWVKPSDDFDINFSGSNNGLSYKHSSNPPTYEIVQSGERLEPKIDSYWTHIGIVKEEDQAMLFIDGRASSSTYILSATDLNITALDSLLVDEVRIYGVPLSDAEIRYLSGRTYLDISGNKYHAAPMGSDDFLPITPESVSLGDGTAPANSPYPNSVNGSGRLGDSYSGELNGLSLLFDGAEDYLDLSTHALEFGLNEGTFSFWVKTSSSQSPNPIFWSSSPPVIDVFTDTETNETQITITPGSFFALELSNGLPRIGGIGANKPGDRVNDGQWHHIVATFPTGQIWIDGDMVSTSPYDLQDTLYEGFDNLFSFSADSEIMNIGRAMDRTIRDQEIFFNGRLDDFIMYDRVLENNEVQFLYGLRRGREQVPRLEAVVDAVGTVTVNESGAGYRENPELVFWYGGEENKTNLDTFPSFASLEGNITDANGTHGAFAYVEDEDAVYSYHQGTNSTIRSYSWRQGDENGWRRLIDANGIGEFENASVGEVVWVKKMDSPTTFPLPDGRMVERAKIDYVTMNEDRSTPLESNASLVWPWKYYQPHGLFGFDQAVTFSVSPPTLHNEEEIATESPTAEVYTFYFLDQEMNETVNITDGGHGITSIPASQVRINGSGYQPGFSFQKQEDHKGFAEITVDANTPLIGGYSEIGIPDVNAWSGSKDVNISTMEFNQTFSSLQVSNPGFGYSMPVELKVIGGYPQLTNVELNELIPGINLTEYNSSVPYDFEEAILEVEEIDPNTGAITKVKAISGGKGYVNYQNLKEEEYPHIIYPMVSVSGGGGRGAQLQANVETNGSIDMDDPVSIINGGIGYFNWVPGNRPIVKHSKFGPLDPGEKNATLEVRLGGYIKEIPRCKDCEEGAPLGHDVAKSTAPFSHLEPWIEIWDRGRSETDIDAAGDRAHGAPKVVNGKINKIVMTKSGRGYIDPVAYVRDIAPKATNYWVKEDEFVRKWRCTFVRTTKDGQKIECGHIQSGLYPPEQCPGETDEQFPYTDENGTVLVPTGDQISAWRARHDKAHGDCSLSENHLNASFLARKCWGTKTSYILDDDAYYRTPRSDWLHMDASLSVICENGKIIEIVVEDNGSNYYASQVYAEGSGTGVDAFPVFDEYGLNTSVILDDPNLKNLELDKIPRPKGAGQGFQNRPWSWDEISSPLNPAVDEPELITVAIRHSQDSLTMDSDWELGRPVMENHMGDKIMSVVVADPGLYSAGRNLSDVTIDFNSTVVMDQDFNGSIDFVAAELEGLSTSTLTKLVLDNNASYEDNSSGPILERGLFDERPNVILLDGNNLRNLTSFGYERDVDLTFIRMNNFAKYEADPKKSFIDLYIDEKFPSSLYYGTSGATQTLPAMGNRILVTDAVPGGTWAINEPQTKPHFSYTDQSGHYAFGNLDPGMYYVNVFMEDIMLQESTFRPKSDPTHISQVLYVPGFPELTLESDNLGRGVSSLLWSVESRSLGRPADPTLDEFTEEFYNKKIEGIGLGFDPSGDTPELVFIPGKANLGKTKPKVAVEINLDGSLNLTIVDDDNTTAYFPGDRFSVIYNNAISGVDFFESYLFSESNKTYNYGSFNTTNLGSPSLVLFPDDGGGLNPIEVPLSTATRGEQPFNLTATVFDSNGSLVVTDIDWRIKLDFNSSEDNNTRVAQLEDANGDRELNASGDQVKLYLFSTLREGVGSVQSVEILGGGTGYSEGDRIRFSEGYGFDANITEVDDENGSILSVQIHQRGFDISKNAILEIWDENLSNLSDGFGANLKPIFFSGLLTIEASATHEDLDLRSEIRIRPSSRNALTSRERWLNKYLDSFMEQNASWWDEEGGDFYDIDGDGLINSQENYYGTNPLREDTDLDGLSDNEEVNPTAFDSLHIVYRSNPLVYDSDNDGWSDWREKYNDEDENNEDNENTTNPRAKDTDGDGLIDSEDLDPNNASGDGIISGRIYAKNIYQNKPVYFRYGIWSDINQSEWQASWTGGPTSYYLTGLTDNTYTVQAFINWDDEIPISYSYGEPFAEKNVTLAGGVNQYGQNLIPVDPKPILYFFDPPESNPANGITVVNSNLMEIDDVEPRYIEQNITIESNSTNAAQNLNSFNWGIEGYDPSMDDRQRDLNSTSGVWFEITDGNFTPYLSSPYGDLIAEFDLGSVPVGKYFLTYTVEDKFGNKGNYAVTQNIDIRDAEPPEISFIFQGGGVTTLPPEFSEASGLESSNSSAVLEWDFTNSLTFSDQINGDSDILIQVFDLKNHFENDFENENQPAWEVTYRFYPIDADNITYSSVQDIEDQSFTFGTPTSTDQPFDLNRTTGGIWKLDFVVTDQSANTLDYTLYIIMKTGLETEITAVDGYLSNATVIFDADGDGISDLNRNFYTDINGRTKIILSQQELESFDLNQNGKLDPDEGKFIVIGGIDTSTGTKFSGKLIADANSSVVSPLTTIISKMMDLGATKDEAITALALALDLDSSIDFTSYDPIQEAFDGDQRATDVMLANLRMANLINQAEGLLLALSSDYQGYEVGSNLLGEIAKQINTQISEAGINLEEILIDALPIALASVGTSAELTLDDQLAMYQLMVDLDHTIVEYEDGLEFSEVMQKQKDIIHDLEDLFGDISSDEQVLSLRYHQLDISYQTGGSAGDSGLYPYGSKVAIFAEAETGYFFKGWSGDGILDRNASTTFVTMIKDRNLTAQFLPKTYEVSLLSASGGQVSGGGTFQYGEEANLNAVANEGGEFLGWFKDGELWSEESNLGIYVDQDIFLTAKFTQPLETRTLVLSSDAGGSVLGEGSYNLGETVHIQALPQENFVFDGWVREGASYADTSSALVVMDENYSLHATFLQRHENKQTLVLKSNPLHGGSTTGTGAYDAAFVVTIQADPLPGYVFTGWTGAVVSNPGAQTATILMNQDHTVEANFLPIVYQLTTKVTGQGEVLGGGEYSYGALVNLSAIPNPGYRFAGWYDTGNYITPDQNTTVKLTENTVFEAQFEPDLYTLTINSSSGGLVYGAGDYTYGSVVGIEAHPATGFTFSGWSGNAMTGVETPFHTLTIVEDTVIEAIFSPTDNYFTPRAESFEFWIDRTDYDVGEIIHVIEGADGDQDAISYSLVSGNVDRDRDGNLLLGVSSEGLVSVVDPDEIFQSSGNIFKMLVSLNDHGGKSSLTEGTIKIRPKFILESNSLGNDWYESNWLGYYLTTQNSWIYHQKLGWLFVSPLDHQGYWIWDVSLGDWLWTDSVFYPWLFSNVNSSWYYFNLEEEKVRFFDHNLQKWKLRL